MLTLRPMTHSDIPAVVEIEQAAHRAPWSEKLFQDCLHAKYDCTVLCENEQIVAYAIVSNVTQEAEILNICVSVQHQQQGLGRQFLKAVLEQLAAQEVQTCFLEVRPSNTAAIALYTRLGFEKVGCRKAYYQSINQQPREDAWVYQRKLC